jgi:pimeloyl-ACP methyl ester carboxylesterase
LASFPTEQYFEAADGTRLAWRELGQGRPLLLIHGFISDAYTNWAKFAPTAETIAGGGYRVIMPDLRAHGASGKSHDPAFYPPDVLADDQFALIAHLGLTDFDLGGYSLGAWTSARMLVRGCRPGKAILSGMGLEGLVKRGDRGAYFRHILTNIGKHERGSREWMAEQFLKTNGGDAIALNFLLDSFVNISEGELAKIDAPVGVICGTEDADNGSAEALAAIIPGAIYIPVPGNHMSAVTYAALGEAFAGFLAA